MIGTPRRWGIGVLAFLLLGIVAFTSWRLSLKTQNQARLKAIAVRGEPVDVFALDLSYEIVPDGENAARIWLNGAGQMSPEAANQNTWNKFKLPSNRTNFSVEHIEFARAIIQSNAPALATFREAAALSRSRYPINLTLGVNTLLPHLAQLKLVARLLQAEVVVAVEDRDTQRAADALKTMLAPARSLSAEPLLISQLVSYAIDNMAFTTAEYMLNRLPLTDQQLATLTTAFAAADNTNSLRRGLMGERAIFVTIAKDPQAFLAPGRPGSSQSMAESFQQLAWPFIRGAGFFERDLAFGVDTLTTNIAQLQLPDPARFASRANWDAVENQIRERRYILSGMFLPALSKSVVRHTKHRAEARMAHTALAIERYRLANRGNVPDHLLSLVPGYIMQLPIDPFDGRPLRFKRLDSGYVVYSVGPDTRDDDGLERPPKAKDTDPWDLTFIVERHDMN